MITNSFERTLSNLNSFKGTNFTFYTNSKIASFSTNSIEYHLHLDGYILPSIYTNEFKKCSNEELVQKAFEKYGNQFVNYIKGNFILILYTKENCNIYTDQLGSKKFFIYNKENKYYFSNNLWEIKKRVDAGISKVNIGINALFNHYIEGTTIFENIKYSLRAKKYTIEKNGYSQSTYFDITTYFNSKKDNQTSLEFAKSFQSVVDQYIDLLKIKTPAVTLTGGFDSRIILATLLNRGLKPIVFNYGNIKSKDVQIAQEISRKFKLTFFNNQVENQSSEWFNQMADIIADKGQAITQIHRAHRLDTIIKLTSQYSIDAVFGGYMGGEGILGIYYDDLITSEFVRRSWTEKSNPGILVDELLMKKFLNFNEDEKNRIISFIDTLPYFSSDKKLNHFLFSYMLKGEVHHVQDINLFNYYVPTNIPIYLDLDYLKQLFSSKFNFLYKKNSRNPIKRIGYYQFYSELIHHIFPDLGKIPLAKKGLYSPDEYLANKYVFMGKRLMRYLFTEKKYEPNFSLDNWVSEFVKQSIINLDSSELVEFVDLKAYNQELYNDSIRTKEKDWQKFTDLIMAEKILNNK